MPRLAQATADKETGKNLGLFVLVSGHAELLSNDQKHACHGSTARGVFQSFTEMPRRRSRTPTGTLSTILDPNRSALKSRCFQMAHPAPEGHVLQETGQNCAGAAWVDPTQGTGHASVPANWGPRRKGARSGGSPGEGLGLKERYY